MESRLVEDTFTSEEVKDMLTGGGALQSVSVHVNSPPQDWGL